VQLMMKLIGGNSVDFNGLDSTYGTRRCHRFHAPSAQPQEPIYVQVSVRQYPDVLSEVRQSGTGNLDLGRMPVGSTLDCYV